MVPVPLVGLLLGGRGVEPPLYCTVCVLLFFFLGTGLQARSQFRKVLRPVNSTQVFLGFPVSISKC